MEKKMAKKTRRVSGRKFPNWPLILKSGNPLLGILIAHLYSDSNGRSMDKRLLSCIQKCFPKFFTSICKCNPPIPASFIRDVALIANQTKGTKQNPEWAKELCWWEAVKKMSLPHVFLSSQTKATLPITPDIINQLKGERWAAGKKIKYLRSWYYLVDIDFSGIESCNLGDVIDLKPDQTIFVVLVPRKYVDMEK